MDTAIDSFGAIDIIVNNAGYTWDNVIQKMTDEQWQAMLDVHLTAPFRILRAAQPVIRAHGQARGGRGRATCSARWSTSRRSPAWRQCRAGQLLRRQGRHHRHDQDAGQGVGPLQRQRQRVAFGLIETRLTQPLPDGERTVNIDGREIKVGVSGPIADDVEAHDPAGPRRHAGGGGRRRLPALHPGIELRHRPDDRVRRRADRHLNPKEFPMPVVLLERDGAVAQLTLNDPKSYNALGPDLLSELNAALEHAIADPTVRVILLTGASRRASAPARSSAETPSARARPSARCMRQSVNPLIERLRQSPKPVVTAVNGAAAGARAWAWRWPATWCSRRARRASSSALRGWARCSTAELHSSCSVASARRGRACWR